MSRENIYQSINIYYESAEECPLRDRQFNFFELIYVLSGTGLLEKNGNKIAFKAGDLILITPNDSHAFHLASLSDFLIIDFDKSYINEYQWKSIDHIECLLYYASHLAGSILQETADIRMVQSLMQSLLEAVKGEDLYSEDLKRHLVNALLVIAARNISKTKRNGLNTNADKRILKIIDYIQANICCPQELRVPVIANAFGLSQTYLGSYFYKHCGETLQHYISSYRMRLIEHRLRFSDMRINEIVDEFGFVDESHINKFFKRHRGMSLKAYRQDDQSI